VMTVYLVTKGCYSDYSIVAIYSRRDWAEDMVERQGKGYFDGDEARIEEYNLDEASPRHECWYVDMSRDGTVNATESYGPSTSVENGGYLANQNSRLISYCWAMSEEHAVKIANERRAAMIALDKWPPGEEGEDND